MKKLLIGIVIIAGLAFTISSQVDSTEAASGHPCAPYSCNDNK